MKRFAIATSAIALGLMPAAASAQTSETETRQSRQQERVGAILGTLFGDRFGSNTLETQWAVGRMPLATQQSQFETRVDSETRSGGLNQSTATRLKADYGELVRLEARYGADRRFTTQERQDLSDRYGRLTQALTERGYGDEDTTGDVAKGKAEFERRVDASVSARRLSRVQGTRLKADYAALIDIESGYLRDGTLSARERDDLDTRLDALDGRVGDTSYGGGGSTVKTPKDRIDAITSAVPSSGLSTTAAAQLQVELGDLTRLEAAYGRTTPTADDRAYLERRLGDLETRAKVRR